MNRILARLIQWWTTRHARAAYRRLFADRAVRIHDDQEITYSRKKRSF